MRALVACERSGVIREAFREIGHDAYSCDLEPADDASPFHYQGDALEIATMFKWDLVIGHPPCTYLAGSGNAWNMDEGRAQRRREAVNFFKSMMEIPSPKIAMENPVGALSRYYRKPDQYIQPCQFGHPWTKKTGLWLVGLPLLVPTLVVEPEFVVSGGRRYSTHHYMTGRLDPSERQRVRSETLPGIAQAMAEQWGRE